jgi:Fic family protein
VQRSFTSSLYSILFSQHKKFSEIIKEKGAENVKAEDLISEVTAKGRTAVPPAIKAELLQEIRQFLSNNRYYFIF